MAKIKIEKHDSVKMYRIRKTLDEISDKTGHGTELSQYTGSRRI